MKTLRAMLIRFAGLFRRKQHEAEMNNELRAHLDGLIERNLAAGMAPDEARYAALRAFGGVAQIAERVRDERRSAWGENFVQEVCYATRQLRKTPVVTVVVVLSLACGIGANSALFSVVDRLLFTPLPVKDPHGLFQLEWVPGPEGATAKTESGVYGSGDTDTVTGLKRHSSFSRQVFETLRTVPVTPSPLFASADLWGLTFEADGESTLVTSAQLVSGHYFSVLGVTAALGRTLQPEDDRPGAAPVAVISDRLWRTRFRSDPAVLGKAILVNRVPATIIGVAPPAFAGTHTILRADIILPLALRRVSNFSAYANNPGFWWLRIMGRATPGVSVEPIRARFEPVFQQAARAGLSGRGDPPRLRIAPAGWGQGTEDRRRVATNFVPQIGMAALVLLAACANAANLLVARGAARRREIAVRVTLGASRGRIIRQLLAESIFLALLAAGVGLLLARWGADLLSWGRADAFALDHRVVGFTSLLALLTGVGFGLAPALRTTRSDVTTDLKAGAQNVLGRARGRLGQAIMVVQVATSLVLLVVAGLFIQTLRNLHAVDVGFNRENLLLFGFDARSSGYKDSAQLPDIYGRLLERVATVPGIKSATFSAMSLLGGLDGGKVEISIPGRAATNDQKDEVVCNQVGPAFFETFEIPLLVGRGFTGRDNAGGPRVVVIDHALAQKYFGDENPIGQPLRLNRVTREVVGVVRDVKQIDLRQVPPLTAYVPALQEFFGPARFAVRTVDTPGRLGPLLRAAVRDVDPAFPALSLHTQNDQIEGLIEREALWARLSVAYGGLALVLACVGLYGLISFSVTRRTGEIGLRMALGALPRRVLWMILRESFLLVSAGVAVGIFAAFAATRFVAHLLYGLSATDAATYGSVGLLLIGVALVAALLPARRAAKIDPMVALRAE